MQAVVTVLAVLLMMPPIILIFNNAGIVQQIPVVVAFIFGAWLVLIAVTWWLVRLSNKISDSESDQLDTPTPPIGTDT